MLGKFISSVGAAAGLSSGGTITGDLTVSGDLTVTGGGAYDFAEEIKSSTDYQQLKLTDTDTDNTTQRMGIVGQTYNAEEPPLGILAAYDGASSSFIGVGGTTGDNQSNTPMEIRFFTSATHDVVTGTQVMTIDKDGNVGIGTTAPTATGSSLGVLHVENSTTSSATQGASIRLSSKDGALMADDHRLGVIDFAGLEDGSTLVVGAQIEAFADAAYTATGTYDHATRLEFAVQSGTSGTDQLAVPAMIIDANSRISLSNNDSGAQNTIFGKSAGNLLTSGCDENVIIGDLAMDAADGTESYNVCIGSGAMGAVDEGSNEANSNVAIGAGALTGGIVGSSSLSGNIAIGAFALDATSTNPLIGTIAIGYSALGALTSGANNVAMGYQAMSTATTALNSVSIGRWSMKNVKAAVAADGCIAIGASSLYGNSSNDTTIGGSIAIGSASLYALQTGIGNIGIGYTSLTALTTGVGNTAVGYAAMATNVDGSYNTAVGYESLYTFEADTANHGQNTGVGYQSGKFISTGTGNTFLGYKSGLGITGTPLLGNGNTTVGQEAGLLLQGAAAGNTLLGSNAGVAITTGTDNVFIGSEVGKIHTTTTHNVGIGSGVMTLGNATGSTHCVAIGFEAMKTTAVGDYEVAIGYQALKAGGNGKNVCIGFEAGMSVTHDSNIFIGRSAGKLANGSNITHTVAIGTGVLNSLLTGAHNTAFGGNDVMASCTTGTDNVAVGYQTARYVQTAHRNVWVGMEAGLGSDGALLSGTDNVCVGYRAGYVVQGASNYNTLLGSSAGNLITTGISNTLIGYEADADAATDSYQTRIGHYGALRYMTAQLDMSGDEQGSFTNAGTDNRPATGALLKIPQYGFLKRVTCTVVTASGGTGVYNISLGNTSVAAGTVLDTQVELIGVGAADGTGTTSRTQAADAASDTNLDIVTAKYVHIWEANQATDNCAGWADVDKFLYICHAGTGNAENAQDAVLRITAEFFGED